jgi:hypothetical protein
MIRPVWLLTIGLALLSATELAAEGRLQQVRDDARSSSSDPGKSSTGENDDDSWLGSLLCALLSSTDENGTSAGGLALAGAWLAPFYVPACLLGDDYNCRLNFTSYPFADGFRGYQILPPEIAHQFYDADVTDAPYKSWAVRVTMEEGNDIRGLNRVGALLKFEHASRFGVTSNWNWFTERLGSGRYDQTWINDTNLTFRFAQNEVASLYTGLGFRVLTDRHTSDGGINFTYGGDWFPVRPLVVSGVFDVGTLGSAGVIHGRASVGAVWHHGELFTGYDFLRIGSVNLQGPMIGVRVWF